MPPSLRGGQRPRRHCEEAKGRRSNPVLLATAGLLRLRLAMTVKSGLLRLRLAMTIGVAGRAAVIAWRPKAPPSLRGGQRPTKQSSPSLRLLDCFAFGSQ